MTFNTKLYLYVVPAISCGKYIYTGQCSTKMACTVADLKRLLPLRAPSQDFQNISFLTRDQVK